MVFKNRLFSGFIIAIAAVLTFQACSPTQSALNPNQPQVYLNSYQDVIDAINTALKRADLRAVEAEFVDDNTYYVKYFSTKVDMQSTGNESNPESALMAEATIKKLGENRTQITIKEEEQSGLAPGTFRENLGRDLLRELKDLLDHESEVAENQAS